MDIIMLCQVNHKIWHVFVFWMMLLLLLLLLRWEDNHHVVAVPLAKGLSDPRKQPIFVIDALNALDPAYIRSPDSTDGRNDTNVRYTVPVGYSAHHRTGLVSSRTNTSLTTKIFAYGNAAGTRYTWPGYTFVIKSYSAGGPQRIQVNYQHRIPLGMDHILPVDTTVHWAYSCQGYENYTMKEHGIPISPHLHGGKTNFIFDGHPEAFFTTSVVGPLWSRAGKKFTNLFAYENKQEVKAATLWYHDHTLGITRLNVYAGMLGFYIIRDEHDTGDSKNAYGLPYGPYELAYVIQDKMFTEEGQLFYPAFTGDPSYDGYIINEGLNLPESKFGTEGGPTALAEFFGDHIVVNGKIWPKVMVEPTQYRIHLLNGCDSRFLVLQFVIMDDRTEIDPTAGTTTLNFTVIGGDQGLGSAKLFHNKPIVLEVASRIDIIIDFSSVGGKRIILQNLWSDAPFGDEDSTIDEDDLYPERYTDRIMAFNVIDPTRTATNNPPPKGKAPQPLLAQQQQQPPPQQQQQQFQPDLLPGWNGVADDNHVYQRHLALFEGRDEYGRIEPLLGAATTDANDPRGLYAVYTWSQDATEKPVYMSTEDWYLINYTEDAHAMHIHLTEFQVIGDFTFTYTTKGEQTVYQHMGKLGGQVPIITSVSEFQYLNKTPHDHEYIDGPKDTVIVRPGDPSKQIGYGTIIRMKFIKTGIYEWHCHILSHEDHEMMREYLVVPRWYAMWDSLKQMFNLWYDHDRSDHQNATVTHGKRTRRNMRFKTLI